MAEHFAKLDGQYSQELIQVVKDCLQIDPLARPQSVFALQKLLAATPALPVAAPAAPAGALEKIGDSLRGLAGRFGLGRGKASGPNTQQ